MMEELVERKQSMFIEISPVKIGCLVIGASILGLGIYLASASLIIVGIGIMASIVAERIYAYVVLGTGLLYMAFRFAFVFLYDELNPLSFGFSLFSIHDTQGRTWIGHIVLIFAVSMMYVSTRHGYKRAKGQQSDNQSLSILLFLSFAVIIAFWCLQAILDSNSIPVGTNEFSYKAAIWLEHFCLVCFSYSIIYCIFFLIGGGIRVTVVQVNKAISSTYNPRGPIIKIMAVRGPTGKLKGWSKKKKAIVFGALIITGAVLAVAAPTIAGSFLKPAGPRHGTGYAIIQLYALDEDGKPEPLPAEDWRIMLFNYSTEEKYGEVNPFEPVLLDRDTLAVPRKNEDPGWPMANFHPACIALEGSEDQDSPVINTITMKRKSSAAYFNLYDWENSLAINDSESFDSLIGTTDEIETYENLFESDSELENQTFELTAPRVTHVNSVVYVSTREPYSATPLVQVEENPTLGEFMINRDYKLIIGGKYANSIYNETVDLVENYFNITYQCNTVEVFIEGSTCAGFFTGNCPSLPCWWGGRSYIPKPLIEVDGGPFNYYKPLAVDNNLTDYTGWLYLKGASVEINDGMKKSDVMSYLVEIGGTNYTFAPFGQFSFTTARQLNLYVMSGNITEIGVFQGLIDDYSTASSDPNAKLWKGLYGEI